MIAKSGGIENYLATRFTPNRDELAYLRRQAHRFPQFYEAILRWVDLNSYHG